MLGQSSSNVKVPKLLDVLLEIENKEPIFLSDFFTVVTSMVV
jgi:hypothetical protein